MRIREEIRLGVGALLAIQILALIAAVALLARMTPAIEQILVENEKSIAAIERMLSELAAPVGRDEQAQLVREQGFARALAEAEGNITEASEEPVIAAIAERSAAALAGDPRAIQQVRSQLWTLGEINRESMRVANTRAKRLGTAGAWALVLLGLLGVGLSIGILGRARVKLIDPIYEMGAVLEACSDGERHRRFRPSRAASREFHEVAEVVNLLVAEHFAGLARDWDTVAKLDRAALLRLLDGETGPVFVCDREGSVAAANTVGLELLAKGDGEALRSGLAKACAREPVTWVELEALPQCGWVCRVRGQPPAS